jgi:Uma2 family endonuclease
VDLAETDGEPLETPWHRDEINLLVEQVRQALRSRRRNYFVGGNMFIYFNLDQARKRNFKGPDFFFVDGVEDKDRRYYVVWEEGGRYPDVIIELLSPKTRRVDLTTKKDVYERVFRTPEYFCYDPQTRRLRGWRLTGQVYEPLAPDSGGRLHCRTLGLSLGEWEGEYQGVRQTWVRFFDGSGEVVPLFAEAERQRAEAAEQCADGQRQRAEAQQRRAEAEQQRAEAEQQRAEAERQRAEAERQRADAAEIELARLKGRLDRSGKSDRGHGKPRSRE